MASTIDLTGDPEVEEQIRQYYIRKREKEDRLKVVFTKGVATRERSKAQFTIDNSHVVKVSDEDLTELERQNKKAWDRHYKGDKVRRKHEENQEY